jgi:hypothetical protein
LVDPKTTRLVGKTKFEDEIEKKNEIDKKNFPTQILIWLRFKIKSCKNYPNMTQSTWSIGKKI